MTINQVIQELKPFASEQTRKVLMKHGAPENTLGIKVQDMKKIQKKVKKDQELACALYNTGVPDYMYLAGLIADESKVTGSLLDDWLNKSNWQSLTEYTIPWLAADSGLAHEKGLEWIRSSEEKTASAGWAALSSYLSITEDDQIDKKIMEKLLEIVINTIHHSPDRVKYQMNGFLIAVGSFYPPLTAKAISAAEKTGKVTVNMGDTACKVPDAAGYIEKIKTKGYLGKKKKMARC